MKSLKWLLSLALLGAVKFTAYSQLIIDLSDKNKSTESIDISKIQPVLVIKNLIPKKAYEFSVDLDEDKIPAFNKSNLADDNTCKEDDTNKPFKEAYKNLKNTDDETAITKLINLLQAEIEKLKKTNANAYAPCILQGIDLVNLTTLQKKLSFALRNNQTITVTVKRKIEGKDSTAVWVKVFKTPQKSPWLTHFGFTYQPNVFSKYDQYYSKADTSNANKFYVTKKNGNQTKFWENLSPTVMFSYPFTNKNGDSHLAFSAIAATNFSTFSAGAGFSGIVGTNVAIGTGIMFTQKYVLNGIYKEGDIIKSNLTYEQLHEKKWGPELYFTIGLRFDRNPFTSVTKTDAAEKNTSTGNQ